MAEQIELMMRQVKLGGMAKGCCYHRGSAHAGAVPVCQKKYYYGNFQRGHQGLTG